ncbi:MAG TPA: His-Xaa-Ser system radical SAM maturase HxsB [Sedimentisphaerales bacterium]|nr:His-Xaa-Ser system radical SAM maturase HxsB [Sedimentisphaerales bacterium]
MPNQENYKLLPFKFLRLKNKTIVTNMGGDFLLLPDDVFRRFVNYEIQQSERVYLDLKAKHFIYDESPHLPIQLLATQYRTKKSFLRNFTSLHMIVVTLRCNQKCRYCQVSSEHADAEQFDMTSQTAKKCVDLIFKTPSPYVKIEFQGGEPLLNFEVIKYIVEYAESVNRQYNKDLEFVICTNLVLITDDQLVYCKDHGINISTSIDGPPDVHNGNRLTEDGRGSYDKVLKGLEKARRILDFNKVAALMATTKASLGRFPEIVDHYILLGFHRIFFRSLNPYGRARKHQKILGYSTDDFLQSCCEGLEHIIKLNLAGTHFVEEYSCLLLTRMLTPFTTGYVDLQSPTGAGIGGVIYDYDGRIYVADEGRMLAKEGDTKFLMGHVDGQFEAIFGGATVRRTIEVSCVECLPQCIDCAFQMWCGADPVRNYAIQGDLVGHRPTNEFCRKNMGIVKYWLEKLDNADDALWDVIWSWVTAVPISTICSFGMKHSICEA